MSLGNEIDAREYKNDNYFDWLDSRDVINVPANQTLLSPSEHNFFKTINAPVLKCCGI